MPPRSAPMLNTFATISSRHAGHSTHREYRNRMAPPSPRPVTIPSRAHISCTAAISGKETRAVHRKEYPKTAPATEYVEIPEGSSSAAPVISPGPRLAKNRGTLPRCFGCAIRGPARLLDRYFFLGVEAGIDQPQRDGQTAGGIRHRTHEGLQPLYRGRVIPRALVDHYGNLFLALIHRKQNGQLFLGQGLVEGLGQPLCLRLSGGAGVSHLDAARLQVGVDVHLLLHRHPVIHQPHLEGQAAGGGGHIAAHLLEGGLPPKVRLVDDG